MLLSFGCSRGHIRPSSEPSPNANDLVERGRPLFVDVSYETGIRTERSRKNYKSSYGPLWVDLNGDRSLDLIFMNHGRPPGLWISDGNGFFENGFDTSGLRSGDPDYYNQWDRHGCACGDYNNDGAIDLFIVHGAARGRTFGTKSDELLQNEGNTLFFVDESKNAQTRNTWGRARFPSWVDIDNDGFLDLYIGNAKTSNVLYLNRGDGTFLDVTEDSNLGLTDACRHVWFDVDQDGDSDLIALPPLKLYRNNGELQFEEVNSTDSGLSGGGKGLAIGDFDSDGQVDLFVTAIYPAKNRLFKNIDGTFKTVHGNFGPEPGEVCKGAAWGDLENDGDLDLVVGCSAGLMFLWNNGKGVFNVERMRFDPPLEFGSDADVALGDYDGDGDLDVATVCNDGNHLLRNTNGDGNWIEIWLRGTVSNRSGFGAKVSLASPEGFRSFSEYSGDSGYFGSVGCGPLHFGLGDREVIESITIHWPTGKEQNLSGIDANQVLELVEPQ